MKDFYETRINAESHPFRVAYNKLRADMSDAALQMDTNRYAHDAYVLQQVRLKRLHQEEQALLKIMSADLTSDLIVAKLGGLA